MYLMSRMTNTGQDVERTIWLPSDRETPGGWRKTRLPSAPLSWRKRTQPSAKRWLTYGKSWANARMSWRSMKLGTGPCKWLSPAPFFLVVGWHFNSWTMCFLFDSTTPKPTCLSSALYQKQKQNWLTLFFICVCVCVHISALPFLMKPSSKGDTFLPGLLRTAIVSFYVLFFLSMLLLIRIFMLF